MKIFSVLDPSGVLLRFTRSIMSRTNWRDPGMHATIIPTQISIFDQIIIPTESAAWTISWSQHVEGGVPYRLRCVMSKILSELGCERNWRSWDYIIMISTRITAQAYDATYKRPTPNIAITPIFFFSLIPIFSSWVIGRIIIQISKATFHAPWVIPLRFALNITPRGCLSLHPFQSTSSGLRWTRISTRYMGHITRIKIVVHRTTVRNFWSGNMRRNKARIDNLTRARAIAYDSSETKIS